MPGGGVFAGRGARRNRLRHRLHKFGVGDRLPAVAGAGPAVKGSARFVRKSGRLPELVEALQGGVGGERVGCGGVDVEWSDGLRVAFGPVAHNEGAEDDEGRDGRVETEGERWGRAGNEVKFLRRAGEVRLGASCESAEIHFRVEHGDDAHGGAVDGAENGQGKRRTSTRRTAR